jgi:predicted nuclease with TOPRIM domain
MNEPTKLPEDVEQHLASICVLCLAQPLCSVVGFATVTTIRAHMLAQEQETADLTAKLTEAKAERDEYRRELNVSSGYVLEAKAENDRLTRELAVMRRIVERAINDVWSLRSPEKLTHDDLWQDYERCARAEQGQPAPVQSNSFTYDGGGERSCQPPEKGSEHAE